jgi:DNA-binding NtrC family response regulator
VRVLVVSTTDDLRQKLSAAAPGYHFESAQSGGQALDRASSGRYQVAMVAGDLHDLPSSMVVRSMKTQHPELLVLAVKGPGKGGSVELVEATRRIEIVKEFTEPSQLVSRLGELSEAFHARARERRYMQAFKEKHYDFLRKFVEIKAKIDRALE